MQAVIEIDASGPNAFSGHGRQALMSIWPGFGLYVLSEHGIELPAEHQWPGEQVVTSSTVTSTEVTSTCAAPDPSDAGTPSADDSASSSVESTVAASSSAASSPVSMRTLSAASLDASADERDTDSKWTSSTGTPYSEAIEVSMLSRVCAPPSVSACATSSSKVSCVMFSVCVTTRVAVPASTSIGFEPGTAFTSSLAAPGHTKPEAGQASGNCEPVDA